MNLNKCTDPKLRLQLHAYELDQLNDTERDSFEEHLMSCPFCLSEVRAMRPVAAMMTAHREEIREALYQDGLSFERLRRQLTKRRESFAEKLSAWIKSWFGRASLATAVAAAVLFIFLFRSQPGINPYLNDLSFELPAYQTGIILRGEGEDEAGRLFESAMKFYNHGEYAAAAEGIQQSLHIDAKPPERWLYLGVSQFAQWDAKHAVKSLKQAVRTGQGLTRIRAQWYLAESYMLEGKVNDARALLQSVAAENGEHAADSRLLLSKIAIRK